MAKVYILRDSRVVGKRESSGDRLRLEVSRHTVSVSQAGDE